ncbi:MAG: cytochrome ubiquinol oxidase subunit I, partial [Candidatus Saccharibacteria bacterium]
DTLAAGRALMGDSLGFHIIIALLSIGIPFILNIFEFYYVRKKTPQVLDFIHLLSRWTVVLAVAGVISGTIISLQFAVLWAPFLATARPFVGKFFMLETYAFLVEAIFLAWYVTSWKKLSPFKHWLIGLPVTIGAIGSAFFITIINAWMNNPSAIITSTTWLEITHSVAAYLFATVLLIMGYVAWRIWRSNTTNQFPQWLLFRLGLVGFMLLLIVAELGHQSAVSIASTQPTKLAAIEILDTTQTSAPLRIGGSINSEGKATGGIVLPGVLSLLAGYSLDYKVHGLNEIQRGTWPMLVVHSLFDIKMALVGLSSAMILGALFFYWKFKRQPAWFVKILAFFGLTGIVMVELGWMLTELGRQPWAINGRLLVKDAFTKNLNTLQIGYIFPVLFVILLAATLYALGQVSQRWRREVKSEW